MNDQTLAFAVALSALLIGCVLLDQWRVTHQCPYRGCPHKGRENE